MTWQGWVEIALTLALTLAVAWPSGIYLARVLEGETTPLDRILGPLERALYAAMGPDAVKAQNWLGYTAALLACNAAGFAVLYLSLIHI